MLSHVMSRHTAMLCTTGNKVVPEAKASDGAETSNTQAGAVGHETRAENTARQTLLRSWHLIASLTYR